MADTLILDLSPEASVLLGTTGVPVKTRKDGTNQSRFVLTFDHETTNSAYWVFPLPAVTDFAWALIADAKVRIHFYAESVVDSKEVEWMFSYAFVERLDDIDEALSSEVAIPALVMSTGEENEEIIAEHTISGMFTGNPADTTKSFRLVIKLRRKVDGADNMEEEVFLTGGVCDVEYVNKRTSTVHQKVNITNTTTTLTISQYWAVLKADSADAQANLPATPYDGQEHKVTAIDVTNNCIVAGNGRNIRTSGGTDAATSNITGLYESATFVYDATTDKWYRS